MLAGVKNLLSQPALDTAKGWGASFLQSLGGAGTSRPEARDALAASPPPWAGLDPVSRDRVLAISKDASGLLRGPPPGSGFQFDLEAALPTAAAAIDGDEGLRRMRFELVPRRLSEGEFWRNYFYRVSLIRRSAHLSASAAQQQQRLELKRGEDPQVQASAPSSQPPPPPQVAPPLSSASSSCDSFERLDCDEAEWEQALQLELAGDELATSARRSGGDALAQ